MQRNIGIDLLRAGSMLYIVGFWHLLEYTRAIDYQNDLTHRLTWIALAAGHLSCGRLSACGDPLFLDHSEDL